MKPKKFRVWNDETKKFQWTFDYSEILTESHEDKPQEIRKGYFRVQEVQELSVEQLTGLTDSKCKSVFEGDIFDVRQTINGQSKFVIVDCVGGMDVRYAYDLKRKYEYDIKSLLEIEELEVIGNIHENPELL